MFQYCFKCTFTRSLNTAKQQNNNNNLLCAMTFRTIDIKELTTKIILEENVDMCEIE